MTTILSVYAFFWWPFSTSFRFTDGAVNSSKAFSGAREKVYGKVEGWSEEDAGQLRRGLYGACVISGWGIETQRSLIAEEKGA